MKRMPGGEILYLVPTPGLAADTEAPAQAGASRIKNSWIFFLAVLIAIAGYETVSNFAEGSALTRLLATLVLLLGAVPALGYLKAGMFRRIPFFEGHCLFYSISFGYAGFRPLQGVTRTALVTEYYLQQGLLAALVCLLLLYLSFYGIGSKLFRRTPPFSLWMPDSRQTTPGILIGELLMWAFLEMLQSAGMAGMTQITEFMRAYVFVHFISCQFLAILPRWAALFFWLGFVPWMLLFGSDLVNGRIFGLIQFAMWQTMALLWAKGRISLTWLFLAGFMVVLFQPVKAIYRSQLWGRFDQFTTGQKVDLFFNTLLKQQDRLQSGEDKREAFEDAFSRVNQLNLTACVIRDTPALQPHQYGLTYLPLLTKWIPRIIWPDKPIEDLGNRWGRQYGYLGMEDYDTSLNLPWLTEMFINFGWAGVIGVPLIVGLFFRWLWAKLAAAPGNSVDFSIGVALLTKIIIVESHFSLTVGGVFTGFIFLYIVLFSIRSLLGIR